MNLKFLTVTIVCASAASLGFFFSSSTTKSEHLTVPTANYVESKPSSLPVLKGKKSVERLSIPSSQVIYITGVIDAGIRDVVKQIKEKQNSESELYLLIDSPGGSVLDGALVLSAIESSTVKVNTVCIGLCASMAFIIHQYGHKRMAVDRTVLMAHPASGGLAGTLEQMDARLSTILKFVNKIDAYIAKKSGIPYEKFKNMIVSELWVDAEDAKALGFVDTIVDINTDAVLSSPAEPATDTAKNKMNFTW
jgi:ATP-dependent Clp protease protease subunit